MYQSHSEKRMGLYEPRHTQIHTFGIQYFTEWLDENNQYASKHTVKYYIDIALLFFTLYTCTMIGLFQFTFIFCILKVVKYQKILENRFLGPPQNLV
jgi:hypothetical protein